MKIAPASNNIRELLKKAGITGAVLAKKVGTSAPHMSRLIRGKSPLTPEWILKISRVLKVPAGAIQSANIKKKSLNKLDDNLLGSVMGWINQAASEEKLQLNNTDFSKLTNYVFTQARERLMANEEIGSLALTVVQVTKLLGA